jgi:CcmD family protein
MSYLFVSYMVIWSALFAYLLHISAKQRNLNREIETLKRLLEEKK